MENVAAVASAKHIIEALVDGRESDLPEEMQQVATSSSCYAWTPCTVLLLALVGHAGSAYGPPSSASSSSPMCWSSASGAQARH